MISMESLVPQEFVFQAYIERVEVRMLIRSFNGTAVLSAHEIWEVLE